MTVRTYNRINFTRAIKGNVSISKVYGYPVQTKFTQVQIHNVSYGGLSFSTPLNFRTSEIELLFRLHIFGKSTSLRGTITWQKQDSEGFYHYGVRLTESMVHFYQILDQLSPQQKNLA